MAELRAAKLEKIEKLVEQDDDLTYLLYLIDESEVEDDK